MADLCIFFFLFVTQHSIVAENCLLSCPGLVLYDFNVARILPSIALFVAWVIEISSHYMWYSKLSLRHDLHMWAHMLRSLFTVYLIISQNVLIAQIAQNAQVAASSVASRGETACVHLREAPEEDSSAHLPTLCPYKYKYGIYADTAKKHKVRNTWKPHRRMSMSYISWLCFQQV